MTQSHDYDTRPERPAHDSTIDYSAILAATAFTSNDPASRGVEVAGSIAIIVMIAAAVIVNLVR